MGSFLWNVLYSVLCNITDEALQQLLLDFRRQMSFLGLSIEEERIIE